MRKRIGKDSLKAAAKPSPEAIERFAQGSAATPPAPKAPKEQGVKVTIYLSPEMEQRLRSKWISKPAPRGHFYGMLVDLIRLGEEADERKPRNG